MASPFPGMDPYLEAKALWPGFHHGLAGEVMAQLNAQLSPKYYADVEVRTVLEDVQVATSQVVYPDAAVLEGDQAFSGTGSTVAIAPAPIKRTAVAPEQAKFRTVRVYLTEDDTLVTAIEILSPVNKSGRGVLTYREKRRQMMQSEVHLVEIDLLRGGQRPGWEVQSPPIDTDYMLLVNRANDGDTRISEIWPIALNAALPVLPIPLLAPDPDVPLDLGAVLNSVYRRSVYARRIDYTQPLPPPAPRPAMTTWLTQRASGEGEH